MISIVRNKFSPFTIVEMKQDERWMKRYNEVIEFIEREHRKPSKYAIGFKEW